MNNLPKSHHQIDFKAPKFPLMRRLYDLPISRKTNLIPWFSFGGLAIVLGAGGLILYGTLKDQLLIQAESRLNVKSQVIKIVLSEGNINDNLPALSETVVAFTGKEDYSAIYLQQENGELALASASVNSVEESNSNLGLSDNQLLDLAIANSGTIVNQIETDSGKSDRRTDSNSAKSSSRFFGRRSNSKGKDQHERRSGTTWKYLQYSSRLYRNERSSPQARCRTFSLTSRN